MLDRVFLQVLDMSLNASYVIVFILLARLALQKLPKVFSYALWSIALYRLLSPWSFESVISLFTIRNHAVQQLPFFSGQSSTLDADPAEVAMTNGNAVLTPPAFASSPDSLAGSPLISMPTAFWLIGVLTLLAYSIVTWIRLKKQLKEAVREKDNIYLCKHVSTPFVMGLIRPKIYLPQSLSGVEKGYILLHEQIHIRRLDHIVKFVSFFVLCLHWFNPLVWAAFFLSAKDMEMSCYERVIKKLGYGVKKDYSASLLALTTGRRMVGSTPLAFGEGDVKGRIKNVLNYKKPAFWVMAIVCLAVVTLSVGLLTNPLSNQASMQWAKKLQAKDIEKIELVLTGNEHDLIASPSEISEIVALINESRGRYISNPEPVSGGVITFNMTTKDGTHHSVSNIANTYLWIDGDYYDAGYRWLSNWPYPKKDYAPVSQDTAPALNTTPNEPNELTFWIKPDEPDEVIANTAVHIWLKSYMGEHISSVERLSDYVIDKITIIPTQPKPDQTWHEMAYHYVIQTNYRMTTDSADYANSIDGIYGKGTFEGLSRNLYVKDLGQGNFSIVSISTERFH